MADSKPQFNRILLARVSAENGCHGPEESWLTPATVSDSVGGQPEDEHFFVSLQGRRPNRYGWVAEVEEVITVESLMALDRLSLRAKLGDDANFEVPGSDWYESYLAAVASQPVGTPMGCDWLHVRGPGVSKRRLRVHKIFFYNQG